MVPDSDPTLGADEAAAEDARWMRLALDQALAAYALDEVPIGCVLVREGALLGAGHNRTRSDIDPTAHAEVLALRQVCAELGEGRLPGAVLYTTVEPCFMCAGALVHARIARVVWGVRDPKFGGCASLGQVLSDSRANHRAELSEGCLAEESRALLKEFFRSKRGTRGG